MLLGWQKSVWIPLQPCIVMGEGLGLCLVGEAGGWRESSAGL